MDMDTLIMDMDTGAERREKLKLLLKLQLLLILMLRLIPGMDTMVDTMDMDTLVDTIVLTDIYGAERRGKLKLLLILMLRLIPGMDIMVDTMDLDMVHTMHTLIMDMDTGAERREKLKLLLKLQLLLILMLRLIPGMDTMVDTMDIDTMVILMLDTTWVNEEQDCNICKHLYMCTHLCSTHVHTKSTKDVVRLI